jgi:hypothetical protein
MLCLNRGLISLVIHFSLSLFINHGYILQMFTNQCSKCGEVFETKNPKRVICPNCLYPEGGLPVQQPQHVGPLPHQQPPYPSYPQQQPRVGYTPQHQNNTYVPSGNSYAPPRQPQGGYRQPYPPQQGYNQNQQGGYPPRPQGMGAPRPGGYGPPRPQGMGAPRPGGYGPPRPQGMGAPQQGGYGPPRPQGPPRRGNFGPPPRGRGGPRPPKRLLVTREQLIEIEKLYKENLPLPNPDVHEIIGEKISLAPSKVFFGMNLVRMAMKLPKLEYPKRKLAVTPEQLMAVETLYEPYLPLPPLGIHKIISKQLRMDEWRVHVAIGLVRKNKNLARWNEEREDLTPEMRVVLAKNQEERAQKALEAKAQKELEKQLLKKQQEEAAEAAAQLAAAEISQPVFSAEVSVEGISPSSPPLQSLPVVTLPATVTGTSLPDKTTTTTPVAEGVLQQQESLPPTILTEAESLPPVLSEPVKEPATLPELVETVEVLTPVPLEMVDLPQQETSASMPDEVATVATPKRRGRPPGKKNTTATPPKSKP